MISCNVILDILPLYIDGAVCEDTKKLVKEHLEGCENCRREAAITPIARMREGKYELA